MPDDVPPEVREIARDARQRKIAARIGVAVFLAIWVWAVWVTQP